VAKVGGVAAVVFGLSRGLEIRGNSVELILPKYDCMRYDQSIAFDELLRPHYTIDLDFYYGILPTATPYARNAIFSGLLPRDMTERFPQVWAMAEENEHSRNQYEEALLHDQLDRHRVDARIRYDKLIATEDGRSFAQQVSNLTQHDLSAVVVNFVDILAHSRSDSDVIKELAPDEQAYRALTRTWFEHSWLFDALRDLAQTDATVILTSDHGAIRSLRSTKVIGDQVRPQLEVRRAGRHLRAGSGNIRPPAAQHEHELHPREGRLLLRLPHELPPLREPLPRHDAARRRLAAGDDPPHCHAATEVVSGES